MKIAENIFTPSKTPLSVRVLVLSASNTLSFAAATDPMRACNRRAGQRLFDWDFVTASGDPAELTTGLWVTGEPIAKLQRCDLLILVAGFDLEAQATPRLLASLRRLAQQGTFMLALDGAPWLLARAGLLDGQSATTHWEDLEAFAATFPDITVRRDRYCLSGPFATSGGAAPTIDLMLHLIATRWGDTLAARVAAAFLYDPVPEGAQEQSPASVARPWRDHPQIGRALSLMDQHIEDPMRISDIARRCGLSQRRLEQLFQRHLGHAPAQHYLTLRLTEAHRLALDSQQSVQAIAMATGFSSQSSFARAFKSHHGLSLRDLRAKTRL